MASEKLKRKRQRRKRREKLHRLRQKLAETRSAGDRQRLIAKIQRVSPNAPIAAE